MESELKKLTAPSVFETRTFILSVVKTQKSAVSDFENADSASEFIKKFLSQNGGLTGHKIFIISDENFLLLKEDADIEKYNNFYLNNYSN